jgi:hypothetical protein
VRLGAGHKRRRIVACENGAVVFECVGIPDVAVLVAGFIHSALSRRDALIVTVVDDSRGRRPRSISARVSQRVAADAAHFADRGTDVSTARYLCPPPHELLLTR